MSLGNESSNTTGIFLHFLVFCIGEMSKRGIDVTKRIHSYTTFIIENKLLASK